MADSEFNYTLWFIVSARVVYVAFCVVGIVAVPEARDLLNEDFDDDGSTLCK